MRNILLIYCVAIFCSCSNNEDLKTINIKDHISIKLSTEKITENEKLSNNAKEFIKNMYNNLNFLDLYSMNDKTVWDVFIPAYKIDINKMERMPDSDPSEWLIPEPYSFDLIAFNEGKPVIAVLVEKNMESTLNPYFSTAFPPQRTYQALENVRYMEKLAPNAEIIKVIGGHRYSYGFIEKGRLITVDFSYNNESKSNSFDKSIVDKQKIRSRIKHNSNMLKNINKNFRKE